MWTVVYMAQSKEIAINLQNLLMREFCKVTTGGKDEKTMIILRY